MSWKLDMSGRRRVTLCNHNYSKEGIYHPDRVMEEYDLLFLQQGSWEVWEEDQRFSLEEGMALLFVPGRHHYSLKKCTPEMKNVFVHFTRLPGDGPGDGPGSLKEVVLMQGDESVPGNAAVSAAEDADKKENDTDSVLILDQLTDCRAGDRRAERLMERIINCFWDERRANRDLWMQAYLEELLLELSDLRQKQNGNGADPMTERVLTMIRQHPEMFFSPEELAETCSVSVRTFSSRFKQATGQSVHQYQLHLKLAMARDALLENPNRSLKDLAAGFGFYDEFQFSRLFKREFGVSPSVWRK